MTRSLLRTIASDETPLSHDVRRIFVDPKPMLVDYSRHLPDLPKYPA
jgi:hypothetical protein